ncbi:heme-binding protein [Polynucleobacter sp. IMCC30063]|nr:heme-binding protein [Polynucleobacter sp. IMCC30063]MCE7505067.1 heme-binding protein [Polynucleobacter sp. IMCC30063]
MRLPCALFFLFSHLLTQAAMAIEEPQYTVIEQQAPYELRAYAPHIVAEVLVDGDLDSASNSGFRLIAAYIFGGNQARASAANNALSGSSEKIAMTVPVSIQPFDPATASPNQKNQPVLEAQKAGQWKVSFLMPSQYTLATLPVPLDRQIQLREIPAMKKAVMQFSGFNSAEKVAEKTAELRLWMEQKGLKPIGEVQFARYNPPWSLPFMRRSEVLWQY